MEGGGLLFHASWTAHPWSQKLRMSWITHKRHFRKGNQIYLSPELMHENIILLWIWYFTFYCLWKKINQVVIVSYHIPETLGIKYSSKPPPPKNPRAFPVYQEIISSFHSSRDKSLIPSLFPSWRQVSFSSLDISREKISNLCCMVFQPLCEYSATLPMFVYL